MSYLPLNRSDLAQTLKDSRYPPEKIQQFMEAYDSGKMKDLISVLSLHRGELLNNIHERQGNLDCMGMNLAKALKGDGFLGALIGAILCYPSINGVNLELFGHTINATYTSSFLPVIAVTAVAVPLARWLNKYIPKVVANFVTPVITLAVVIPFGFTLIGPAVNMVGSLVNAGITALLNTVPLLAVLGTVGLNGKPFKAHVKSGDKIEKGQLLLEFDIEEIKAAGCPVITPVLVANESEVGKVTIENDKIVIGG